MPGAQILLVEDDEVLYDVIGQDLRARGHEVCVAKDRQQAQCLREEDDGRATT
jgi:DNA-binding response OmpR family regulator